MTRSEPSAALRYTAAYPVSLGFVELLLADPEGGREKEGIYPVRDLDRVVPRIECVPYEIPFAARSTWWSYYVVVEPSRIDPGELRIRHQPPAGEPRITFLGPCRVQLPGGRTAWRFVSQSSIALARRPSLHLQLVRRREGGRRVDVLMDRLPLADGTHLVQAQVQPLCGGEPPGPRASRLLEWLSNDASSPDSPDRLFSDIYVHV